jgi:hypothetical protein
MKSGCASVGAGVTGWARAVAPNRKKAAPAAGLASLIFGHLNQAVWWSSRSYRLPSCFDGFEV